MDGAEGDVLQLWMIALLATVYMHDSLVAGAHRHAAGDVLEWWKVGLAVAPFAAIAAMVQLSCWACGKEMDRRGSMRAVRVADRTLIASRVTIVATHGLNVFLLGWVGQVRAVVGDGVMVDEMLAILPAVGTIILGWLSFYPIEQRLRRATLVRVLEEGTPAYPEQSRRGFVWSNIRHQLLFVLVPLTLMGAWSEVASWGADGLARQAGRPGMAGAVGMWLVRSPGAEAARFGVQLLGVMVVFLFAPVLMRLVWDATPLGAGPLRDRLMRISERAGVRVRELLVWRTYGTMVNGAAMGVVAPLRYILLTDALLDQLPRRQVESVMAHEVGHAKHHHIPWLVLGLMGVMGLVGVGAAGALVAVGVMVPRMVRVDRETLEASVAVAQTAMLPVILIVGFAGFGWISRRFEWQADAFAARELSRDEVEGVADVHGAGGRVTAEAVDAMCGALGAVANLGSVDPGRWSFRHGSIAERQRRLSGLVGVPLDGLPIDRMVRWIKWGIVAGIVLLAAALLAPGMGLGMEGAERGGGRGRVYDWRWRGSSLERSTLEDRP